MPKRKSVDALPEDHPVWVLVYVAVVFGALAGFFWVVSRWLTVVRESDAFLSIGDVLTPPTLLLAAMLLAAPVLVAMSVVALVGRARRRSAERADPAADRFTGVIPPTARHLS